MKFYYYNNAWTKNNVYGADLAWRLWVHLPPLQIEKAYEVIQSFKVFLTCPSYIFEFVPIVLTVCIKD